VWGVNPLIVTGTDTDIGKSVVASMLTLGLEGIYWKPIQAGTEGGTDTERVVRMTGLGPERFRRERYILKHPLSPHRAAELEGITIDEHELSLPDDIPAQKSLIIEGAGGVLVPVTRNLLQADLFAQWKAPAILCARTALGTINHSLLSIEALRARGVKILGIVFVGDEMADTERTIVEMGGIKRLGRLPFLSECNPTNLRTAFAENFRAQDFGAGHDG
jgi:dethiobiotin synthetase